MSTSTTTIDEATAWLQEQLKVFSARVPEAVVHNLDGSGPITRETFSNFFLRNREGAAVTSRTIHWCLGLPGDIVFMLGNISAGESVVQATITVGTTNKDVELPGGWASFQDYRRSSKNLDYNTIETRFRAYKTKIEDKLAAGGSVSPSKSKAPSEPKPVLDRSHEQRGGNEVITRPTGKPDGSQWVHIPMTEVPKAVAELIVILMRGSVKFSDQQ